MNLWEWALLDQIIAALVVAAILGMVPKVRFAMRSGFLWLGSQTAMWARMVQTQSRTQLRTRVLERARLLGEDIPVRRQRGGSIPTRIEWSSGVTTHYYRGWKSVYEDNLARSKVNPGMPSLAILRRSAPSTKCRSVR